MSWGLLARLHRWASGQDENFATEAFAHLLENLSTEAPVAGARLLRRLLGDDLVVGDDSASGAEIVTQHHTPHGIPDMRIEGPGFLAFVEVKVDAPLAAGQEGWYLAALRDEESPCAQDRRRLVLLTRYPMADGIAPGCRTVRWFEIGDELERLLDEELPQITQHRIREQLGFMEYRGLMPPAARSAISAGLRRYEQRSGAPLIQQTKVMSLGPLDTDEDLHPLRDLMALAGHAIEMSGLFQGKAKLGSGQSVGGWLGWNLESMRYFFTVAWSRPETLVFSTHLAPVRPEKWDEETGQVYQRYGAWHWSRDLDLLDGDLDFFALPRERQLETLVDFLRTSLAFARALESR